MYDTSKSIIAVATLIMLAPVWSAESPVASTAVPPVVPATSKPAVDHNKLVCKRVQALGTLFYRKLCKTERDWQIEEELAKDIMKRVPIENSPSN
jgi:hypothetical protein